MIDELIGAGANMENKAVPMEHMMFHHPFVTPMIGVPPWPAVAPLLSGLADRGDVKLVTLTPEAHRDPFAMNGCACALVSPGLLLDDPALHVLPGAGLVARETATPERLLTEAPLESIHRIRVTSGAEALTRYVQVLFAERGLPMPKMIDVQDGLECDAILVSSVDGEQIDRAGYDVAALWRECTDTPLVHGVWACRSDGPIRLLRHVLGEAARRGEMERNETDPAGQYYYRMLSAESDAIRALHRLARKHAIAGTNVESIGFC